MTCVNEYATACKDWIDATTQQTQHCTLDANRAGCQPAAKKMIHAQFIRDCIGTGVGKARCDARWTANPRAAEDETRARMHVMAEPPSAESNEAQTEEQAQQIENFQTQLQDQRWEIDEAKRRAADAEAEGDAAIGMSLSPI